MSACRGKRDGSPSLIGPSTCLTGPCITDTWPAFQQRVCAQGDGSAYVSTDNSQAVGTAATITRTFFFLSLS